LSNTLTSFPEKKKKKWKNKRREGKEGGGRDEKSTVFHSEK